jgi:hypothetical protein
MIRKLAPLVLLMACMSNTQLERKDWTAVNNMNGTLHVRAHDGTRFDLETFTFTKYGLLASRGSQQPANSKKSRITDAVTLPYDSIDVVQIRQLNKSRTLAAIAGAAAAGYILIGQSRNGDRPEAVPRPVTSCPFIYSFDGYGWRLDSETYAGAVARGLERTDIDNLDHIASVGGTYRLALANEVDETEYTDELTLLVAEHPGTTHVFPDMNGVLHTINTGSSPITFRQSNLVSIPAKTRWEATFRRPSGKHLALVIRVRNTDAVPFVHQHLMNLLGDDVYSWYREVNSNPNAAKRTMDWYTAMAGLRISTSSGNWIERGVVPIVGPIVAKTIVVPFDDDTSDDFVRVRLESSPMLWNIESIRIATETAAPEIHEVKIKRAVDADGNDVTSLLRDHDGNYHVALNGSRVIAEFDTPKLREGMRATVIARTTGHYYARSTDDQRGHPGLVAKVMSTSLFAQSYLMLQYRQERRRVSGE